MTDHDVIRTMELLGGSFTKALALACYRADPVNLAKIKATWPDLFKEYQELTELRAQQQGRQ